MKKQGVIILVFVILFSALTNLMAQTAELTINISGIKEQKGSIQLGLYDNDENFPKENLEFITVRFDADSAMVTYVIPDLPHGDYAIAFYHDINDNGKINKNWLGIPTEPYGFSNNVRVRFSAPSFEKTKFSLVKDMEIFMIFNK